MHINITLGYIISDIKMLSHGLHVSFIPCRFNLLSKILARLWYSPVFIVKIIFAILYIKYTTKYSPYLQNIWWISIWQTACSSANLPNYNYFLRIFLAIQLLIWMSVIQQYSFLCLISRPSSGARLFHNHQSLIDLLEAFTTSLQVQNIALISQVVSTLSNLLR